MKKPYAFISYSSKSKEMALTVRDHLNENGISCWMAPESLERRDCSKETADAIVNCDAFVLLLDEEAQKSKWIPHELLLAVAKKKGIYPVLWDEELSGIYSYFFRNQRTYSALANGQHDQKQITKECLDTITAVLKRDLQKTSSERKKIRLLLSVGFVFVLLICILLTTSLFNRKQEIMPPETVEAPLPAEENRLVVDVDIAEPAASEAKEMEEELKKREVFGSNRYQREQIGSITFVDSVDEKTKDAWEVSAAWEDGAMAWVRRRPADDLYDLYIGAEGGVYAPENCNYLFAGYTNLVSITFNGCFHTGNVRSMEYMFASCPMLSSLFLSDLDLRSVESMCGMFAFDKNLAQVFMSNVHTPKLRSMERMFDTCNMLNTIDLGSFQTEQVSSMQSMFRECTNLKKINFGEQFNTAEVTDMSQMFCKCESLLELDLKAFDTGKVETMRALFSGCSNLAKIEFGERFNTAEVKDISYMFNQCESLISLALRDFDTSKVEDMQGVFYGCKALNTLDLRSFNTDQVKSMQSLFEGCTSLSKIEFGEQFTTANVTNLSSMFCNCASLSEIPGLNRFNMEKVQTMRAMFNGCTSLTKLEFGEQFTTENVTDLSFMFCNCASLSEIPGLSGFNTEKVQTMRSMFNGCTSLTKLEFGEQFTTSEVTNMNYMFYQCESLTELDLSRFDTGNVETMYAMFSGCKSLTRLELGERFTNEQVTDMQHMFRDCESLTGTLDLSMFNTGSLTNLCAMFLNCKNLSAIKFGGGFTMYAVIDMSHMFRNCEALTGIDLRGFDTGQVKTMSNMFHNCKGVQYIKLGESCSTANVTAFDCVFENCGKLKELDLRSFDTSKAETMMHMFRYCGSLETILYSDTFVIPEGTNTADMFTGCDKLTDNALYQRVNGT